MTHDKLISIRDTLRRRAEVLAAMPPCKADLGLGAIFDRQRAARVQLFLRIAKDAEIAALDGCPESLASVEAFIATDHELSMASHPAKMAQSARAA